MDMKLSDIHIWVGILVAICSMGLNIYFFIRKDRRQKKEHLIKLNEFMQVSDKLTVFFSRDAMFKHLFSMYNKAKKDDVIWGQAVSGNAYGDVAELLLKAVRRGVTFEIIFPDMDNDLKEEMREQMKMFSKNKVYTRADNDIRIQGLSDKEVVIALPSSNNTYFAVLIKDEPVVRVFRNWLSSRFDT